jgi:hypothetical protein
MFCSTTGRVSVVFLLIHVRFIYRLITRKLYRLDAGQWYRLIQLYSGISHSDSVTVVSSFYLIIQGGWTRQGHVVVATFQL